MISIHSIPNGVLIEVFRNVTAKDICAIAQVCRRWHDLSRSESIPCNRERLARISFENIKYFDQLPKVRLSLRLRTFTIFQDILIGESDKGALCLMDPKSGAVSFLDYRAPYRGEMEGEFMTSYEACVYKVCRSWFLIDLEKKSCELLNLKKMKYRSCALLGKKIISWQIVNLSSEYLSKRINHRNNLHPFIEMQIYDLVDHSISELTYRTNRAPQVCISGGRMLIIERRWITILDSHLRCEAITFYQFAFSISIAHLINNKLIFQTFSKVVIKDVEDNRNHGELEYNLSRDPGKTLHPFFIEHLGWRFLQFEGTYSNRAMWFLEECVLTRVNFLREF